MSYHDTPRTNKAISNCRSLDDLYGCEPLINQCRQLERDLAAAIRERDEARARLDAMRQSHDRVTIAFHSAEQQRDAERTRAERWKGVVETLVDPLLEMPHNILTSAEQAAVEAYRDAVGAEAQNNQHEVPK
jgi:hypothetical protein